ncbi:transposable element Tc1 transposase [Trichonephila clavipes]|uniref:Transposable element Tc1 transposase n=1 Tax=Trichonephila clavipes TaxID=2585209 RepID=A0A8X6VAD0_TRICX|nr:transposable element Tc1 transposase [Trichonephila clavipes]
MQIVFDRWRTQNILSCAIIGTRAIGSPSLAYNLHQRFLSSGFLFYKGRHCMLFDTSPRWLRKKASGHHEIDQRERQTPDDRERIPFKKDNELFQLLGNDARSCWEQWTRDGTHARKTGSGATRKTTRIENRRIVRQALVNPTVTRSSIRVDVGVAIVPQTISRHLAEANVKSKRSFRALPLTPEHRQLRLQWCQARSMWNDTYWQNDVFSDDSRFVLGTDDNRVRVWRRSDEWYHSPHTVVRHTARTAGGMVWRAIAYDSQSTLFVMRGTLTGQRYVDDILRPHVAPFLNGLPGAIFQQDNARPHTARVAQDFLHHFQTLPRLARSPDLSPVENVWDQLKRQMPSCHSVHDL